MTTPTLHRIHHVAYRCRDAAETVAWYEGVLGMTIHYGVRRGPRAFDRGQRPIHACVSRLRRRQRAGLFRGAQPARGGPRPQHSLLGAASGIRSCR